MQKLPSDRRILKRIYDCYYETFSNFAKEGKNSRKTKIYVPIDIKAIAAHFRVDPDIVFGRLYYYLEKKYYYRQEDGTSVHLFTLNVGNDRDVVNFPMLASVLSDMQDNYEKYWITAAISVVALVLAILSLIF